jgi:hypothetical protein
VQGSEGGGGYRRGLSRGEDERPATVDEVPTERRAARGKTAGSAESLAQGSDEDVWRYPGIMTQTAPARPQHANCVSLVDDQGRTVFPGEVRQFGEGSDVTVHAEE